MQKRKPHFKKDLGMQNFKKELGEIGWTFQKNMVSLEVNALERNVEWKETEKA